MSFMVFGISHQTANLDIRELVSFDNQDKMAFFQEMSTKQEIDGAVIISTCNRTEFCLDVKTTDVDAILTAILFFIKTLKNISLSVAELNKYFYLKKDRAAVEYLCSVASGLDSMILGDGQILGQIKTDFNFAVDCYKTLQIKLSNQIYTVFQEAFRVAKYIRTNTEIGGNTVSLAYAACLLTRQHFTTLKEMKALVVGAGEMAKLLVQYITKHPTPKLFIANRTLSHAEDLKNLVAGDTSNIEVLSLAEASNCASDINIIFTATAYKDIIFTKEDILKIQQQRNFKKLLLIDLSVPQNMSADLVSIEGVIHYNIDNLSDIIEHNKDARLQAKEIALQYILQESNTIVNKLDQESSITLIKDYRKQSEILKNDILQLTMQKIQNGANLEDSLISMATKLTNQLIHKPTLWLQHFSNQDENLNYLTNSIHNDIQD